MLNSVLTHFFFLTDSDIGSTAQINNFL